MILSDTPPTYGRITVALGFSSTSWYLVPDLQAVCFIKLLGYPFTFSAFLMCVSSSVRDTASEDNSFTHSKSGDYQLFVYQWMMWFKVQYLSVCVFFFYKVVSTDPCWLCFKSKSRNAGFPFSTFSRVNCMCLLTPFRCWWNADINPLGRAVHMSLAYLFQNVVLSGRLLVLFVQFPP